jgi:putative membrane protein
VGRSSDNRPHRLSLQNGGEEMMWGGGWWVIGVIVMLACMYFMARMMMGHGGSGHGDHSGSDHPESTRSAVEILAERFARGKISQEEFEQRKKVLEGSADQVHTAT